MSQAHTNRVDMSAVSNKATHGSASIDSSNYGGGGSEMFNCPESVAYTEHIDYPTSTGVRHHEEQLSSTGTYQSKDVDKRNDGSEHIHRVYDNPNTDTRVERDIERRGDGSITHVHKMYRNATTGDGL
ncbi:hypothetical protein SODALDRAFT_329877 [Sodiomyces alkalinus F11]|uniref:Uncharacterized protein n=1 Tax=Sodiomyces alkalinus (strain CBS 110278 / VKM F-3762 / F11) TaxID=1314773 RepID=A0A3N2Q0D9_SODAK|nr:hypothetical protein SODALDRAFT_329877 [Sodiomyces alkalinus F11]ROT40202.1 hypothetical protein SODALDRAFT_329877 [Sodiomyces alkalinus F11]